ncbi:hypothetical protein HZA57_07495, partial [Candidatus Poribacteria bacterium]|nr:hypothetical protein [Candidatus Poribacteria bacterium]
HENLGKIAYLMTIESAKFRKPAFPGNRLDVRGVISNLRSRTGRLTATVTSGELLLSEVIITFALHKEEKKA